MGNSRHDTLNIFQQWTSEIWTLRCSSQNIAGSKMFMSYTYHQLSAEDVQTLKQLLRDTLNKVSLSTGI